MSSQNPKPTTDFVFRNLYGKQSNEIITTFAINSIVAPHFRVTDITIKNPFNLAAYQGSKESIVDIKAGDQDGTQYSIEMQNHGHSCFGQRALYYPAKGFVDQLEAGQRYCDLNTTIGINFLGYNLFNDDRLLHHFVFKDMETNEQPPELRFLQLFFVELGKMNKKWTQLRTPLDCLAWFMKNGHEFTMASLPTPLLAEPAIVKAFAELERMGIDPQMREIYESEERARMADVAELQYAEELGEKRGREQGEMLGEKRGREQGEMRGRELGAKIGIQQGQRDLLTRMMTRQIGPVPPAVALALDRLSPDQLSDLGEAFLDFHSYSEVEAWLTRP